MVSKSDVSNLNPDRYDLLKNKNKLQPFPISCLCKKTTRVSGVLKYK
jgi:hypothetical protein